MPTIRDVAALAKVSVATVSRVINKKGYVSAKSEQAVLRAMEQLNYEPNSVAQVLAGKKMRAIALVLPDISNPFFPELARAVEDVAHKRGFTVFLCNSDGDEDKERAYVEALRRRSIDGIIFAASKISEDAVREMKKANTPLVMMDRATMEGNYSNVRSNNQAGAQLAVEHLLRQGCRKIAHIHGPLDILTARVRQEVYEEQVRRFDWFAPTLMEPGYFSIAGGRIAVKQLMSRHPDIDGIFAGNDLMAIGALKELHLMDVQVPQQIKICGYDGIQYTEVAEPEITTIVQPIYEMGAMASRILLDKIEGIINHDELYELDVELVERASTAVDP